MQAANAKVCASAFHGDGSNLTGITTFPTGGVVPFAGVSARVPSGFLICAGQAVSRTTYSDLFTVVSITYGNGDGANTFNLPDLRGRVVAGKDNMGGTSQDRLTSPINGDNLGAAGGEQSVSLTEAQLPAHSHAAAMEETFDDSSGITRVGLGRSLSDRAGTYRTSVSDGGGNLLIANTGSGSAHNNVQPTFILNYIIKT